MSGCRSILPARARLVACVALLTAVCTACGSGPAGPSTSGPGPAPGATTTAGTTVIATSTPRAATEDAVPRPTAAQATSDTTTKGHPQAGRWSTLPPSPLPALQTVTGAWTGRELVVVGEASDRNGRITAYAAAYDPATRTWRRLPPPSGRRQHIEGRPSAVWTGREVLVMGGDFHEAYAPATNRWRHLAGADFELYGGEGFALVWTGTVAVTYGGGCCGGPDAVGSAYDPVGDTWRTLDTSLLGARWTSGAWTGREVVIAGGNGPLGPRTGQGPPPDVVDLRTAAAYSPATGRWRALPPMPVAMRGTAVWTGTQVLVLGSAGAVAWSPGPDRWTSLLAGFDDRSDAGVVWADGELLVWGGQLWNRTDGWRVPASGLAWAPSTGWSRLPVSPLRGRVGMVTAWTGHQLLVWGGYAALSGGWLTDGAAYTP